MAIPVTISRETLVYDTLPALKVRYFQPGSSRGEIYTFARFYFLRQDLALNLNVFERDPDPDSRVEFCFFAKEQDAALWLRLDKEQAVLRLLSDEKDEDLAAPAPEYFRASDEQGWSWGANLLLPAEELARAGFAAGAGHRFFGAVFKTRAGETPMGASFDLGDARSPAQIRARLLRDPSGVFEAVSY